MSEHPAGPGLNLNFVRGSIRTCPSLIVPYHRETLTTISYAFHTFFQPPATVPAAGAGSIARASSFKASCQPSMAMSASVGLISDSQGS